MKKEIKKLSLQEFAQMVEKMAKPTGSSRTIIAICGGPGSGKSTLAQYALKSLNQKTKSKTYAYLPMDGFHMNNKKLNELELMHKKGAIETFEAQKYLDIIKLAKSGQYLEAPSYSRIIHDVVENDIPIDKEKIIITEGNYLLSKQPIWQNLADYLDYSFFLFTPKDIVIPRLLARQMKTFNDKEAAQRHVNEVDLVNYDFINSFADNADEIVQIKHSDNHS
ncbi:MAG TPA: hypothetical protein ENK21_04390 [Trueperaceae bacterium]|nr:hypothetical protein [Trueperaceae bacterium]